MHFYTTLHIMDLPSKASLPMQTFNKVGIKNCHFCFLTFFLRYNIEMILQILCQNDFIIRHT